MHEFEIACLDLNTDMTKNEIEAQVNGRINLLYGNSVKFTYDLITPDEIKLHWNRMHPPYGYASSDLISDWDLELLLFYHNTFRPSQEPPLIAPLIPCYDGHYYSPIAAFKELYAMILKAHKENGKVKKLTISSREIDMVIKFY